MPAQKVVGASLDTSYYLVCFESSIIHNPGVNATTEASNGSGFLHKSKLNTNGTFSVGKTWRLVELRAIQVPDVSITEVFLKSHMRSVVALLIDISRPDLT